MVSVLKADISSDYRYAKVYVSVMGAKRKKRRPCKPLRAQRVLSGGNRPQDKDKRS